MNSIDKHELKKMFLELFQSEYDVLERSAREAHSYATEDETKAENKYDTRGLEASYLAQGQANRAADVLKSITVLKSLNVREFNESTPIQATALVELDIEGDRKWFFALPSRGGSKVQLSGVDVTSVSPESPLGKNLFGRFEGEDFEMSSKRGPLLYEIVTVK